MTLIHSENLSRTFNENFHLQRSEFVENLHSFKFYLQICISKPDNLIRTVTDREQCLSINPPHDSQNAALKTLNVIYQ